MATISLQHCAAASNKASPVLFEQLQKSLGDQGEDLVKRIKIEDAGDWTLDLREGKGELKQGPPSTKPDLTLTINDENFAKMVGGKLNPQQAFLLRKLKISGSMALALKLQPILDAAAPKARL